MDTGPFRLILLDAASHAVLLADGPSGEILAEAALPSGFTPVDLAASVGGHIFIALAGPGGTGASFTFNPEKRLLACLPLTVPAPSQFAVAPDNRTFYLTDPAGALYAGDRTALTVAKWGKPAGCGACAGLAADQARVYGVWEKDGGGLLAVFAPPGETLRTFSLGGVPTGLIAAGGRLLVPFTATPFSGEGLLVLPCAPGDEPAVIAIRCSRCACACAVCPVHAAAGGDGRMAYIACEDSAALVAVDLTAKTVSNTIPLGRSVSRIALIGDGRFAVASSNANADLCLIDLINRRPLSFTANRRQILSPFLVIDQPAPRPFAAQK